MATRARPEYASVRQRDRDRALRLWEVDYEIGSPERVYPVSCVSEALATMKKKIMREGEDRMSERLSVPRPRTESHS